MYYNIHTESIFANLPKTLAVAGGVIANPNNNDYHKAGWYTYIPFAIPVGYVGNNATRQFTVDNESFTVTESMDVTVALEPVYTMSKLKLVQALSSLGLLDSFLVALQADASVKLLWDVSVVIDSDNPLVIGFITAHKDSLGLSDQDVKDMFARCVSDL